jgi:hypothetical protein
VTTPLGARRLTAARALQLHASQVAAPAPSAAHGACDEPLSPRLLVLRDYAIDAYRAPRGLPRDAPLAMRASCDELAARGAHAAQRCVRVRPGHIVRPSPSHFRCPIARLC